ncbi:MAG: metallo-beta-lactamase superfamily protein [Acidobacteria bacterium]|nr:metallo-beta-lactamase superfamily protein [Acidobacteriota bacterium]
MLVNQIEEDLYLFVGETYRSNSTIFIAQNEALLVDAVGSHSDAVLLKNFVEQKLGKEVRFIISTHYFSDHLAALKLFPRASVIAHENYADTFTSEQYRSAEEEAHFVEPDILVKEGITIRWGRFTLDVSHNPGHTSSTLTIDIPQADLLMVGDTVVGNIAYLMYSTPECFFTALGRLQQAPRSRLISSHGDVRSTAAIGNALFYLERLRDRAFASNASGTAESFLKTPLENFMPPEVEPTPFERIFHERNLRTILERKLFA